MKTILPKVFLVKIIALAAIFIFLDAVYARDKIYIYSGAGVADAVKAIITSYKKVSPDTGFVAVFASAGDHARQIESGADADVFISADIIWVKYLDDKKLVEKGTAGIFASNELVIVASPNAKNRFKSPEKLLEALGDSNLAMGEPRSVPAGRYGREALAYHKVWDGISGGGKIAYYSDVRKVLNAVETSQCDYGIVYKTDAMISSRVKIVYTFSGKSHSPIEFYVCVIKGKNNTGTAAFMKYLKSGDVKRILKQYGFTVK